jgi:hypothetical protein
VHLPGTGSLIVATEAVRAQYGTQIATAAPAVIASFGTGAQAVQVAVVVPGGPGAYSQAVSNALAARRQAGRTLLRDRQLHVRGAIRTDLQAGLVDPRLITVLAKLAARYAVDVVRVGNTGPQAGAAMPFRMAEVAVSSSPSGRGASSDLSGMEKLLKSQPARYRAELLQIRLAGGVRVLEIRFLAPSPF